MKAGISKSLTRQQNRNRDRTKVRRAPVEAAQRRVEKSLSSLPTSNRRERQSTETQQNRSWCISHGITKPAHQKAMNLCRVTQKEASELLGFDAPAGGVLIVYHGLNGELTNFFRIRFDAYKVPFSDATGQKPMRYAQPRNSGVYAYFAPLIDWLKIAKDISIRLLITEGEAKGACACAHGVPCIALGGVASWRGTKHGLALLPELMDIEWRGREVAIVFDSDAATNPNVQREETLLAIALTNLGARVKIVRLPEVSA